MSKASQLLRGYLQVRRVNLPLATAPNKSLLDGADPGVERDPSGPVPVEVGLKPLSPGEEADIYAQALAYAGRHGVSKPEDGSEVVEYGKALYRCLLGVVDADSDPHRPEPFFDGGLSQLEGMAEIGKEGVLLLAEMHQIYQDEVSGLVADLDDDGLSAMVEELAGPRGGPLLLRLRPGLRASLTLTMARLLWTFLQARSPSGSASDDGGQTSKTSTSRAVKRPRKGRS